MLSKGAHGSLQNYFQDPPLPEVHADSTGLLASNPNVLDAAPGAESRILQLTT